MAQPSATCTQPSFSGYTTKKGMELSTLYFREEHRPPGSRLRCWHKAYRVGQRQSGLQFFFRLVDGLQPDAGRSHSKINHQQSKILNFSAERVGSLPTVSIIINKSLYSSFIWTSTGFLMEILILKEILLGLKRATAGTTDRKCIERSNDQTHLPLRSVAE